MSFDQRIRRLEQRVPASSHLTPAIAVIDERGLIRADGSAAIGPWIGKPRNALPAGTQVIRGIDPPRVLGGGSWA